MGVKPVMIRGVPVALAAALLCAAPTQARFLQPDPLGYAVGPNLYVYVNNDPLNNVDYSGLDTVVIVGNAVSGNPFGHVAIATTGQGVYSYGTSAPYGSSTTAYLQSQGLYRSSTAIVLSTTPEQESAIIQTMSTYTPPSYNAAFCNCATAVTNALANAGIGVDILQAMRMGDNAEIPDLPTTAANMALSMPGATVITIPQGGSVPAELSQFNPNYSATPVPQSGFPTGSSPSNSSDSSNLIGSSSSSPGNQFSPAGNPTPGK